MIRVVIAGAAGRMGRKLVAAVAADPELKLTGAVEYSGCPLLGQDAGTVAGISAIGIPLTSDMDAAAAGADAVIIFTNSHAGACAASAARRGCAVVVGTTALSADEKKLLNGLVAEGARIVGASNMSIGVNVLFKLVSEAASILGLSYDCEIVEMHHNQKKDAPSGTAVTLAEKVCAARGWNYENDVRHGREGLIGARPGREIGMHSLRGGDVVGDHTVIFAAGGERIELTHRASSRDTFVSGALRAVKFLTGVNPGFYDMQDVLGLK